MHRRRSRIFSFQKVQQSQHEASAMGIVDIPWESVAKVTDYFWFIGKDDCYLPFPRCLQLFLASKCMRAPGCLRGTDLMLADDLL